MSEMTVAKPVDARTISEDDAAPTSWKQGGERLAGGSTYWLATVRPDGRPHLVPVLAVWVDGVLHFSAGGQTRKARNIAERPQVSIATEGDGMDVVVEGEAVLVRDTGRLEGVARAYADKYGWEVKVQDGAFQSAGGAPTAGDPPYDVYEVIPAKAFSLSTSQSPTSTRWVFDKR
ncbi:pyridoxamine 5'-phosphate oxidase family protein [Micromonospora sp. PLK6-60]|uniref:pyridoxamine 5'-phosphate oxidase family protein n=1 Tax=Micromonospora sp. PLK6-60 TaxID=2873383 RepID=UPI001CA6BF93|nr:pyridoxamine 5'-phosphate oxidase family protein [Micromonospora sp. PLK6-60]MBY8870733.1 pyridoxamine 5'-phosphate oxidase family protein [Micromonospora sp. PLK6-60]